MENPCYKCGQAVEQGIPFCPHCAAPQIRVVVAQPTSVPVAALEGVAVAAGSPAIPSSQTVPVLAVPMRWPQTMRPCAIAALIAAVAMVLKLVVPLIAVVGAGFLAVSLYRRQSPEVPISAGAGARLGALCGLFCSAITTILGSLRVLILHEAGEIRSAMLDAVQHTATVYSDPQFQQTLDFLRTPTGMVFMMVCMLIFMFLIFLLLATLGGALGGVTLGRRNRP
jgi:hypothetical protein